jgi:hypothetical protein
MAGHSCEAVEASIDSQQGTKTMNDIAAKDQDIQAVTLGPGSAFDRDPGPGLWWGSAPATRPCGVLGAATREQRVDRRLPEISALIDPRQSEFITGRNAGAVVSQGGAGSGKETTIGLHNIAYSFRPGWGVVKSGNISSR